MRFLAGLICVAATLSFLSLAAKPTSAEEVERLSFTTEDWPWWRGPHRNGIADPDQDPPLRWNASENILWKSPIPGRGHASPTVVGSQVFIATADQEKEVQSVLCYDRCTGNQIWKTDVHRGALEKKGNKKSSQASSSVACDGQRLFVNFLNNGAVYTTALSRDGEQLWQEKITDYVTHQGYGSSPALYESLVIVSADNKSGGAIAAFDRRSGRVVWRHKRPKMPNYASPAILRVAGQDQLVFTGCNLVSSFEPMTGKKNWEVNGATTECVTTAVADGEYVFSSGGYPKNHISAVRADGSGETVWENTTRVYTPSMLAHDGYLYVVADAGIAMCWKADSGKRMWKARLGGTFSASPVLVGQHIFVTSESGKTTVFKANPKAYEFVAENQLGEEVFATTAVCGSCIFARVAVQYQGKRQEMLYCIGKTDNQN